MIIILTGEDKDKFMGIFDDYGKDFAALNKQLKTIMTEYQAIGRRLDTIENSIVALSVLVVQQGKDNMATKTEVRADIAEIKAIVAETRGAANSALALLDQYIKAVNASSASAADLDEFRTDLKAIHDELAAERDQIKTALEANAQP